MSKATVMRYFLGSNSEKGFYSLYNTLTKPQDGEFLWVIKGGPGCGKSSFMRILGEAAEESGLDVEYVHCSGDPQSLDAVCIPALKTAYVDGTSPHIIEAEYPGCSSLYLDLGSFYDAGALESRRSEIIALNHDYKELYKRAYSILNAAGGISPTRLYQLCSGETKAKIQKRAAGFIAREMRHSGSGGEKRSIFLEAISCEGTVSFLDDMCSQYDKICTLDNEYGLAGIYLNEICSAAAAKKYDVIICRDALCPSETSAVFIPELSLGFAALSKGEEYEGYIYRHIRLDALAEDEMSLSERKGFKEFRKLQKNLISKAINTLAQAKHLHDKLESIYNPYVDFDSLYRTAQDHKTWLLGK